MSNQQSVAIAGSTGSIGTQALEVLAANPARFRLYALGANQSVDLLTEQALRHRPQVVAIGDASKVVELNERLPAEIEVRAGEHALASIASDVDVDVVLNAVVGFAGLPVTMSALGQGKRLALANKESLIAAGPLVRKARQTPGAQLLPVDSEHGALHQCLRSGGEKEVSKIIVTASGGPFRGKTRAELETVSVKDALNHPTWNMGPKITIDSSTLFNKGLEVIEAHELFGIDYDDIVVTVHPQSIIHSAVEFTDGSTLAQLSKPDMRLPIGYALGYPDRLHTPFGALDWATMGTLAFEPPDLDTFRCLQLAYDAGRMAGTAPAWLNAANEIAVQAFFDAGVTWLEISSIIEKTLEAYDGAAATSIEDVVAADQRAREIARQLIEH